MDKDAERPAASIGEQRVADAIRLEAGYAPVLQARVNPALSVERDCLRPFADAARNPLHPFEQIVARIGTGIGRRCRLRLPGNRLHADRREQQISEDRTQKTQEKKRQEDAHGGSVWPLKDPTTTPRPRTVAIPMPPSKRTDGAGIEKYDIPRHLRTAGLEQIAVRSKPG